MEQIINYRDIPTDKRIVALYIKTGKLTAQTLQKAMKAILSAGKSSLQNRHRESRA